MPDSALSLMPDQSSISNLRVQRAKVATYVVFITCGGLMMSWASRIPQVRDGLELNPAELGLVLLAISVGSITALAVSGVIIDRIGSRATVAIFSTIGSIGLVTVGLGYLVGVLPVVFGLFLVGAGIGAWDVAMNVQGSLVEQHLGHSILPRFHAGYSVGTVLGALVGAAMIALDVPVTAHLIGAGVLVAVLNLVFVMRFLNTPTKFAVGDSFEAALDSAAGLPELALDPSASGGEHQSTKRYSVLDAWKEPRILVIGLFVMIIAFAEGSAIDWVGISLIDGYQMDAVWGTMGLAVFLSAMTLARWFGTGFLDRYGRVRVLRVLSVVLTVGAALFIFGTHPAVAFFGALLWGIGASLGFPVGMSAGGDDPSKSAARVSVIAAIGYGAFLGGPPLIGFLGNHFGVLHGLLAVLLVAPISIFIAGALRKQ